MNKSQKKEKLIIMFIEQKPLFKIVFDKTIQSCFSHDCCCCHKCEIENIIAENDDKYIIKKNICYILTYDIEKFKNNYLEIYDKCDFVIKN